MANPVMLIDGVSAATRQAISRLLQGSYTHVIVARSNGLISSLAQQLNIEEDAQLFFSLHGKSNVNLANTQNSQWRIKSQRSAHPNCRQ